MGALILPSTATALPSCRLLALSTLNTALSTLYHETCKGHIAGGVRIHETDVYQLRSHLIADALPGRSEAVSEFDRGGVGR